jgi:hypothetical protein
MSLTLLRAVLYSLIAAVPAALSLPLLPHPNAAQLSDSAFIQRFAGLPVVSVAGGIGRTAPFFSDLPDGSMGSNDIVNNLAGNFQAFDPLGNPVSFEVVGVEVTRAGSTFVPEFGQLNFAGLPLKTFTDPLDFDQVTFSAGDMTLAFTFESDPSLAYSYSLLVTGLEEGSFIVYDDVEPPEIPEPSTTLFTGMGLLLLVLQRRRVSNSRRAFREPSSARRLYSRLVGNGKLGIATYRPEV